MKLYIKILCTVFFVSLHMLNAMLRTDDIDRQDSEGRTLLFKVVQTSNTQTPEYLSLLKGLLNLGANPNIQDKDGQTAAHIALKKGDIATLRVLLNQGHANPNIVNVEGQTILHQACSLLQTASTEPDIDEPEIGEPEAEKYLKLIFFLIKYGADITLTTPRYGAPLHMLATTLLPTLFPAHAAHLLKLILVRALLDRRVDHAYAKGHAAIKEIREGQKQLQEKPYLKQALDKHCIPVVDLGNIILSYSLPQHSINVRDMQGRTAYLVAASCHNRLMLRLLALLGTDIHAIDTQGDSASDIVQKVFTLNKDKISFSIHRDTLNTLERLEQHSTSIVPLVSTSHADLPLLEE